MHLLLQRQALSIIGLTCCLTTGCGLRAGNTILIPHGYVGWVQVFYGEPQSPPLRKIGGKHLITVDQSGQAHTSSTLPTGYGIDEYFYVSSTGVRKALKQEGVERQPDDLVHTFTFTNSTRYGKSHQEIKMQFETFFVGVRGLEKTRPIPEPAP